MLDSLTHPSSNNHRVSYIKHLVLILIVHLSRVHELPERIGHLEFVLRTLTPAHPKWPFSYSRHTKRPLLLREGAAMNLTGFSRGTVNPDFARAQEVTLTSIVWHPEFYRRECLIPILYPTVEPL
jgi:hypothetical protein